MHDILGVEPQLRLGIFFSVLILMALWEILLPRRKQSASKTTRWISNLGITFLNGMILRVVFPLLAVGLAAICRENGWGVLNIFDIPWLPGLIASIVVLDMIIYFQHILFHMVPALWRLHRMHHTDPELDVTSGARFHPFEIILSMVIKLSAIMVIGPTPEAVMIFEIVLNASAMFNHGNVYLNLKADHILRYLIVTPDMHRIHHSIIQKETNSNFGFFLSWWDRLMGTYRRDPEAGHVNMTIGIGEFLGDQGIKLHWLLIQPFLKSK